MKLHIQTTEKRNRANQAAGESAPARPDRQVKFDSHRPSNRAAWPAGFTLIEVIGVLAVLAILALAVTSSVIKRIDQGALTKETADLAAIGEAYTQSILKLKTIPGHTTWAAAVANQMSLPTNAISVNPRRHARAFLVDPNLSVGGGGLPYTQATNGTMRPISARVMVVSSLSKTLPVSNGIPSSAEFDAIWDAVEGFKPKTALWINWTGTGEDLRIKKVNLEPLFHRLMLVNRDTNGAARFSIDSTNSFVIPTGPAGVNSYYLDGSVLGLHNPVGTPVTKHLLTRDISFVYERDHWRGWIGPGDPYYTTSDAFVREALEFLAAAWNPNANGGASQTGVLVAMYVFMFDYALWAEECPRFSYHGLGNPLQVPEYTILDALGKNQAGGILFDAAKNLLDRN
jgi:prepilin-type N-terminal cleavage/methylation domain-containing protein